VITVTPPLAPLKLCRIKLSVVYVVYVQNYPTRDSRGARRDASVRRDTLKNPTMQPWFIPARLGPRVVPVACVPFLCHCNVTQKPRRSVLTDRRAVHQRGGGIKNGNGGGQRPGR